MRTIIDLKTLLSLPPRFPCGRGKIIAPFVNCVRGFTSCSFILPYVAIIARWLTKGKVRKCKHGGKNGESLEVHIDRFD